MTLGNGEQLPLDLTLHRGQSFENFWPGSNTLLVAMLQRMSRQQGNDQQVFFFGAERVGKTHLLNAVCRETAAAGGQATCISASMIRTVDTLMGMEQLDVVCIDDLQSLPRQADSEHSLFAFINALQGSRCRLVCAASMPVAELPIELPDLRTRLAWGASFALKLVPEQDLSKVVSLRASACGLQLADGVIDYLLNHYSRDLSSIARRLEQLDVASLQAQRRVTIPFVRQLLAGEKRSADDREK